MTEFLLNNVCQILNEDVVPVVPGIEQTLGVDGREDFEGAKMCLQA